MEIFNIIAGVASIIGLLITIVTLRKVINIEQKVESNINIKGDGNKALNQNNKSGDNIADM